MHVVFWKDRRGDGAKSTINFVQTFIDKSCVFLIADSFLFYTLHVTLLIFMEEVRRLHISQGHPITAYLRVPFENCHNAGETKTRQHHQLIRNENKTTLSMLCKVYITASKDFWKIFFSSLKRGIVCQTANWFSIKLRFAISSYIADLLEANDILMLNRRTNTPVPSPIISMMLQWP